MTAENAASGGDRDSLISRAARALAEEPRVIASALGVYRARTGMSEAELADWLGLSVPRLHALALCTKPSPADPGFGEAVAATARYIGCDAERLHQVLSAGHPAPEA